MINIRISLSSCGHIVRGRGGRAELEPAAQCRGDRPVDCGRLARHHGTHGHPHLGRPEAAAGVEHDIQSRRRRACGGVQLSQPARGRSALSCRDLVDAAGEPYQRPYSADLHGLHAARGAAHRVHRIRGARRFAVENRQGLHRGDAQGAGVAEPRAEQRGRAAPTIFRSGCRCRRAASTPARPNSLRSIRPARR